MLEAIQTSLDAVTTEFNENRTRQHNELMLDPASDKSEPGAVLFVTVHRPSIFSASLDGEETVVFRVDGMDEKLITKAKWNHAEFRVGSRWMVVGSVDPSTQVTVRNPNIENESDSCLLADLVLAFELVE